MNTVETPKAVWGVKDTLIWGLAIPTIGAITFIFQHVLITRGVEGLYKLIVGQ